MPELHGCDVLTDSALAISKGHTLDRVRSGHLLTTASRRDDAKRFSFIYEYAPIWARNGQIPQQIVSPVVVYSRTIKSV
jgi:hypothetical protein